MAQSNPLQDLVDSWHQDPARHVVLIDETRTRIEKPHRELTVFVAVHAAVDRLLDYWTEADRLRGELPEVSREEPIKGTDIWRLNEKDEFKPFVANVVRFFGGPYRCFVTGTTQQNLEESPAKVRFNLEGVEDGRPAAVTGIELTMAANFILRVSEEVGVKDRADVFIDQSQKLGLSRQQRKLADGTGEMFIGQLKEGSPVFTIVSGSDVGVVKDLLLLPDFAGNAMLKKSPRHLRDVQGAVTTGTPFWFREVNVAAEMKP